MIVEEKDTILRTRSVNGACYWIVVLQSKGRRGERGRSQSNDPVVMKGKKRDPGKRVRVSNGANVHLLIDRIIICSFTCLLTLSSQWDGGGV